jgi:hypothetical protein
MHKVSGEWLTQACGYLTWVINTTQSATAWPSSEGLHRKKKIREFPLPSRDVTTKLSLGGNNDVITEVFLPRGSLVSDIPSGVWCMGLWSTVIATAGLRGPSDWHRHLGIWPGSVALSDWHRCGYTWPGSLPLSSMSESPGWSTEVCGYTVTRRNAEFHSTARMYLD